jgi:L-asparaginase / beta-aspartyl-peptidase
MPFRFPKNALLVALALLGFAPAAPAESPTLSIVIHGGAGVIDRNKMTAEQEAKYRAGLEGARDAGYDVLERGGTSLDAVTTVVRILEDDPQFNAGRGGVLNHDGMVELDAAIMGGKDLRAGAVAGVHHVKNPVELARLVMENSKHVMLIGTGAEEFALQQGLSLVPNEYFITARRSQELEDARREELGKSAGSPKGTVGAVALDAQGNLAAATSTGGLTNKRFGRVGDSPIIGAGTYANNASCAVSATGTGEYFIRSVVAHDICALVEYRGMTLEAAAREVIQTKLMRMNGDGGIIALDTGGHIVMEFNTNGMFRAARDSRGRRDAAIYRDSER